MAGAKQIDSLRLAVQATAPRRGGTKRTEETPQKRTADRLSPDRLAG